MAHLKLHASVHLAESWEERIMHSCTLTWPLAPCLATNAGLPRQQQQATSLSHELMVCGNGNCFWFK